MLAWFDTRLSVRYEITAVGESGRVYPVSRHFFAPYDLLFSQDRFWYLSHDRMLTKTFGITFDRSVADALKGVHTLQEVAGLEAAKGTDGFSEERSRRFDRFVQAYFKLGAAHRDCGKVLGHVAAPAHIWIAPFPGDYRRQERIVRVEVRQIKEHTDLDSYRILDEKVIRTIEIPE